MNTRRKHKYFEREPGAPEPVSVEVKHRCQFSEVDALAIVWHGRYAGFFEKASEALGRKIGLSYHSMYAAGVSAPLAQLHIDYHRPLKLSEVCSIRASVIWTEASRLNIEYVILKEDCTVACTGYTVQMFVDSGSGEVCILSPDLLVECRNNWRRGDFN
jgi:acyl-CoA thioester hydrolase